MHDSLVPGHSRDGSSLASNELVPFASDGSVRRLEKSASKVPFFSLANPFEGQHRVAMCGPSSAVIVLNALRARRRDIARPRDHSLFPREFVKNLPPGLDPIFARYTQGTFFDEKFEAVKPRAVFFGSPRPDGSVDPGIQLPQLHRVLLEHGLDSRLRIVSDPGDEPARREELVRSMRSPGEYVIVSYSREALGQKGGGHFSPLGAYDEVSDSFLVMDVNPNYGRCWVWAPSCRLFASMRTKDRDGFRGFLLAREGVPRAT
jgi:hypothetical protein